MNIDLLFYLDPLIESLLSNLELTLIAQVSDFSFLRTAHVAEVLEEDIDYEVMRQIFSMVFANILRTQLHLACLNVVASLYERCIEHDSKHCFIRKSCMLKDYLYIAA